MRTFLIYLSKARWIKKIITRWGLARNVASRFVAGESLEEAIQVAEKLNRRSFTVSLDQLGEDTTNLKEANLSTGEVLNILERIEAANVQSNVSIKLTQIGLGLDEAVCLDNLVRILSKAQQLNTFVRIDMEDSARVQATLRIFAKIQSEYKFENVGVVIQSYLFRSHSDTKKLLDQNTRIRVVKGAYKEPPEIAFPKKRDVDKCFDEITMLLLDHSINGSSLEASGAGKFPPVAAIATHDSKRIEFAKKYAEEINLPKPKFEFQMLYGIRRDLQNDLIQQGYNVRIYVPFGSEWYSYFMRRLAERPANLWFFISSLLKK